MLRNEKGVTLVELMISLAASVAIAYVIFVALRVTLNAFDTDNVKMTLQTSAREGLYRMVQEIRESASSRITISNSGATLTFYVPDPSTPVTSSYAVNWGDQIQYAMGTGSNSTKVIRTDLTTNTTKTMATDVTSVSFVGDATPPNIVTVTLNVQRALANGRNVPAAPMAIAGKAKVRNS